MCGCIVSSVHCVFGCNWPCGGAHVVFGVWGVVLMCL